MSKILSSRDEWKKKATARAVEIQELKKAQKRHLQKIAELKRQNQQQELMADKKNLPGSCHHSSAA